MVDRIKTMKDGTRLYLMAPIVRGRKGEYRKELQELQKKGFQRVKVDGKLYEIPEAPPLDKKYKHDIDVVVDRIVVKPDLGNRLADSIETALTLAEGLAVAENADTGERTVFSSRRFACPVSGFTIEETRAAAVLLSTHRRAPARPADGLGVKMFFDAEMVVLDDRPVARRRRGGAMGRFVGPVLSADAGKHRQALQGQDVHAMARPAEEGARRHPERQRRRVDRPCGYDDGIRQYAMTTKPFEEREVPDLDRRWKETDSSWVREELERFQRESKCEACGVRPASSPKRWR